MTGRLLARLVADGTTWRIGMVADALLAVGGTVAIAMLLPRSRRPGTAVDVHRSRAARRRLRRGIGEFTVCRANDTRARTPHGARDVHCGVGGGSRADAVGLGARRPARSGPADGGFLRRPVEPLVAARAGARARAQASGLYLCAYYAGSSVGGWAVGAPFTAHGWTALTGAVLVFLAMALLASWRAARLTSESR